MRQATTSHEEIVVPNLVFRKNVVRDLVRRTLTDKDKTIFITERTKWQPSAARAPLGTLTADRGLVGTVVPSATSALPMSQLGTGTLRTEGSIDNFELRLL